MKKLLLYIILIIACIGIYIGLYFFYIPNIAEGTFDQKKDSLEMSIKRQIKESWNNDNALLYFKDFGGSKYLRMDMDAVHMIDYRIDTDLPPYGLAWDLFPNGRYDNNVRMAFMSLRPGKFDDLYDMYYIQSKPWIGTYIEPGNDIYNIKVFTYTPMFVGYKKETMSLRDYRPSLDKCCIEAKKYIQEEDSDNRMYYSPKNEDRVNKLLNLRNDYYYFQYISDHKSYPDHIHISDFDFAKFNFYNHSRDAFPFGNVNWVYNGFYKVYYYTQKEGNMHLSFNDTKYNQDIETYISSKRTICNIFLLICLGVLLFLSIATYYKCKKANDKKSSTHISVSSESEPEKIINKEALAIYERVIELSNPELFIKPYQPEKLEKANRIYSAALNNKDNINVLVKLLEEAIKI